MKKLYFILFAIIVLSGCSDDYLEKYPLDAPSDQTFLQTAEEMEIGINSVYRSLYWKWNWENVPTWPALDYGTDIAIRRPSGSYPFPWTLGAHDASTGFFKDTWTKMYRSIERANYIIERLPDGRENVEEDFYNRIMSEALFLRAFNYMYLTELFGDVPFIDRVLFDYDEAYSLTRTPKSQIVDQLIADLDFCIANLPNSWGGDNYGRVSAASAGALKARIALYNERWQVAVDASEVVMNMGIALYSDYEKLFLYEGVKSPEVLLSVQYLEEFYTHKFPQIAGSRNTKGWSIFMPTRSLADSYECEDGLPISTSPLYDLDDPYENRDPRLKATLLTPGQWFCNNLFDIYDEDGDGKDQTLKIVDGDTISNKNNDFHVKVARTFTGFLQKKAIDQQDYFDNTISKSQLSTILIRYAEVLLTYAEAKYELGEFDQTVADASINEIRARVGMPAVTVSGKSDIEIVHAIRNERKVELALEGLRMFDIRRWRTAEHVMNNTYIIGRYKQAVVEDIYQNGFQVPRPTFDEYGISQYPNQTDLFEGLPITWVFQASRDYLWPIPQTEIDVVPTLEQNDGY